MNIVQINYSDIGGGAARAAYRLHKGLLQIGEVSKMIVRHKQTSKEEVILIREPVIPQNGKISFFKNDVQSYLNSHRTEISNTIFSFSYPGIDISNIPQVRDADIINLHWIAAHYLSPATLRNLFNLKKPVVWTLHDQWAFTGGCHYSAGCEHYKNICEACPQLTDNLYNLPSKILLDKLDLFKDINLTIVTPSKWLKESARESSLFRNLRIEVLPNSLETDIFIPSDKKKSKEKFGISPETTTILFGTENGREKRKGYHEMLKALDHCRSTPKFDSFLSGDRIKLLIFGHPGEELVKTGVPIHSLGYVNSDYKLAEIYSAADIFVLPSLEDNLPNTMLEAMSCGTPVVAFEVGGMPDLIQTDVTGKLASFGDTEALGNAIMDLMQDRNKTHLISDNCRTLIEDKFRLDIQASSYLNLYKELLAASGKNYASAKIDATDESFSSRYILEADISTGNNFKAIENKVRIKVGGTYFMKRLNELRNLLKNTYHVAYGYTPDCIKKVISVFVNAARN